MGMRYEKKRFSEAVWSVVSQSGVNTVMWNDGDEQMEIDLEKIVRNQI